MIKFKIIIKAKEGDREAISKIVEYYTGKAMLISNDNDYLQNAAREIVKGIYNFKNFK